MTSVGKREAEQLGRGIVAVRQQQGLSRRALARRVGVVHTALRTVELGLGNPSLQLLVRIAQGLRVELWSLLYPGVPWLRPVRPEAVDPEFWRWHDQIGQMRGTLEAANETALPSAS